jgi:hypothetical protein
MYAQLGVQIKQASGKLVWHPSGLKDERSYRYSIHCSILDEAGNLVHDMGSHNRLHRYDHGQGKEIEEKPTSQKVAEQCYFKFPNFALNQVGIYKLKIEVLNLDQVVINCPKIKPLVLNAVAPEVKRIEVIDTTSLRAKLGEAMNPLKFNLFDNENNVVGMNEPITVAIESDYFEFHDFDTNKPLRSPISLRECVNQRNVYEMSCANWKIVPRPGKLSALKQEKLLSGKQFAFNLKFSSRNHRLPTRKVTVTIFPGVPAAIKPLEEVAIKLNQEPKSMRLVVQDQWGNAVAPLTERWYVKLLHGPLELIGFRHGFPVDESNGEMVFINNLAAVNSYEADGTVVEQAIVLKTSAGSDILDTSIPIKIIPSNMPTTLQVNFKTIVSSPFLI